MSKELYPFEGPCPVVGCNNNKAGVILKWVHAKDNKNMYITQKAELVCANGHKASMLDWNFKCEFHDYQPASFQGLLYALTVIVQLKNIDEEWIIDMTERILKQQSNKATKQKT
jgi:hypothetical protein